MSAAAPLLAEPPLRKRPRDGSPRCLVEALLQWGWRWRIPLMLVYICVAITLAIFHDSGIL